MGKIADNITYALACEPRRRRSTIEKDLNELKHLKTVAKRPNILDLLNKEIGKLENQLSSSKVDKNISCSTSKNQQEKIDGSNLLPLIKLSTYAWDQSEKFVKIYVTINNVENCNLDNVKCEFLTRSFELNVKNFDAKDYQMIIKGLSHPISSQQSYFKIKKDTILLMLAKEKIGQKWQGLTEHEEKSKQKKDEIDKPNTDGDLGGNLMGLMRKMYDEGDDEMKRTIKKAWCQAQDKKGPGAGPMLDSFAGGDF
uniref:Calcyclin-binding protein n=1 Tax=Romanomermis culicivorax TaxID=13658 RepID=A0A915KIP2_ROMCU